MVRCLNNEHVKAKELELIKSRHLAIDVLIEDTKNNLKHQPKFKTKNKNWDNWQKHLTSHLSNYIDKFLDNSTENEIEKRTNLLTDIIATTATGYLGLIQASKKKKGKGSGVKDKTSKHKIKRCQKKKTFKTRQSSSNLSLLQSGYQNMVLKQDTKIWSTDLKQNSKKT